MNKETLKHLSEASKELDEVESLLNKVEEDKFINHTQTLLLEASMYIGRAGLRNFMAAESNGIINDEIAVSVARTSELWQQLEREKR